MIVTRPLDPSVQPDQINAQIDFMSGFSNDFVTQCAAGSVVRFLQALKLRKRDWSSFLLDELKRYYNDHEIPQSERSENRDRDVEFDFGNLIKHEFIIFIDGRYHVTNEFINECLTAGRLLNCYWSADTANTSVQS